MTDAKNAIETELDGLSEDAKQVVVRVFAIERDKLHMSNPIHIVDEITEAIKGIIK